MPAFLYFIPDHETTVTLDRLRAWRLDYAFERVPYHARSRGPAGSGTLLVDDRTLDPLTPTYRPAEQTWQQQPGCDFWVGFYTDHRPTIGDLARPEKLPGPLLQLADGHRWQVPLVRHTRADVLTSPALPCYLDIDDAGQPIRGEIAAQHAWLWQICTKFWDSWLEAITEALLRVAALPADATAADATAASQYSLDYPDLLADAVKVLSANYRIGLREAIALRLFRTDAGPAEVLKRACDTERAGWHLQKKNRATPAP